MFKDWPGDGPRPVRLRHARLQVNRDGLGSLGGVAINAALRQSYLSTGSGTCAFWIFMSYYAAAALLTWTAYARQCSR